MNQSDLLTVPREVISRALHLEKNASYRLFPRSVVRGRVRLSDVRSRIERGSRNGATLSLGFLSAEWMNWREAQAATALTRPQLRRAIANTPHFVLSGKNLMVRASDLAAALAN